MITEDYVSFETAKLLKEKGFDEITFTWYNGKGKFCVGRNNFDDYHMNHFSNISIVKNDKNKCSAPTLQTAMKWIRDKGFHIFAPIEIDYDEDERGDKWYHNATYYPEIRRVSDGKIMYDDGRLYAKPEQAYEVAIRYCLENLL